MLRFGFERRTPRCGGAILLVTILLIVLEGAPVRAERWLTGPDLRKQLFQFAGFTWKDMPLRRGLTGLSRQYQVAVLLDRRVDPGRKVSLSVSTVALNEAFQRIAAHLDLGVCLVGSVVYFGPPEVTDRLRTVVALRDEEARQLPAAAAERFRRRRALAWEDFATPRGLLTQIADEAGIRLAGLEKVPHDLWASGDIPPSTLVERLTLVAGQFDLTFRIAPDGASVELVPMPQEVLLTKDYPGGRDPQALARKWAAELPGRQIEVRGERIYVTGTVEEHEQIDPARTTSRPHPPRQPGELIIEKYTVKNKSLAEVLQTLAKGYRLEIKVDSQGLAQAGISLDQLVSFTVEDMTVGEFLSELLPRHGLRFRKRGQVVEIFPAP